MKLWIQVEDRGYEVEVDILDPALTVKVPGRTVETPVPESVVRPRPPQKLPEDSVCRSPIAGRVAAVVGAAGSRIRRNEPVVVIEAMKMEVPIGPAVDGIVKVIHVQAGDAVSAKQVLFELS